MRAILAGLALAAACTTAFAQSPPTGVATASGTWTPTLQGSTTAGTPTYTNQVGSYDRFNRFVVAHFFIVTTALGSPAGNMQIGGLPAAQTGAVQGDCWISQMAGVTFDTSYTVLAGVVASGGATVTLMENGSAVPGQAIGVAKFAAATTLSGTCIVRGPP